MGVTVVVGGQYGSEGKGKVVALTAARHKEPWVVRCGGPNSGHSVTIGGKQVVLRQVPAAVGHPNALLLLSAGCAIDEQVLLSEVRGLGLPKERIVVDQRAVLIDNADREAEKDISERIASTGYGTGAALIRRMTRRSDVRLAIHSEVLRSHVRIESVAPLLHNRIDDDGQIIVEGTQGFGLSLLHGTHYPFVTARDTTAAGFAAEAGLSPRQINDITLVIRTFPIRVGGKSGSFDNEISWEEVRRLGEAPETQVEYTSVTHKVRRVARFNMDLVAMACQYNRPTALAVMGLDRLHYENAGASRVEELTDPAMEFISRLESVLHVPVSVVGTGFQTSEAIMLD